MASYHGSKHTKKNKQATSAEKRKKLWLLFNKEIGGHIAAKDDLQLLYSSQSPSIRTECEKCGAGVTYGEDRFLTCASRSCGHIHMDTLDPTPEWRYYGGGDGRSTNPTRCGMPVNPLLEQSSYGCKVVLRRHASYEMRKIRRYTEWQSMPYREKAQYDEFQRIKALSRAAGIPKVIIDDALRYHKKISEMRTFRGCNRQGVIAASIYIGSRVNSFPRTPKEIATIFKLDNTSATKGCKNAVHLLNGLEKEFPNNEKTHFHQTQPVDFVDRFASRLAMTQEVTKVCQFVALRINQNRLIPENTPHSVAAGIVYFVAIVCRLPVTKRDVCKSTGVSEVTINKCYRKLESLSDKLIPTVIIRRYATNSEK